MTVHYQGHGVVVHAGDCLDVLAEMGDATVDSVVTDPPYGLEFMGKEWDAPWKATLDKRDATTRFDAANRGQTASPFIASKVTYTAGAAYQAWCRLWAAECLRVLKPGGHLLAFGGTRTSHRLACAIEDAGFEIRDSILHLSGGDATPSLGPALYWVYGSG